jgi:hypothetical protein
MVWLSCLSERSYYYDVYIVTGKKMYAKNTRNPQTSNTDKWRFIRWYKADSWGDGVNFAERESISSLCKHSSFKRFVKQNSNVLKYYEIKAPTKFLYDYKISPWF